MQLIRRLAAVAALIALGLSLSGCLYLRLVQTYQQLCADSPRITVERRDSGGRAVMFAEPTLLDSDVACLMGAAPSAVERTGDRQRWTYRAVPAGATAGHGPVVAVDLDFVSVDGRFRLAAASLPRQFEEILSPRLVERSIEAACNGRLDLARRTAAVDLTGIEPAALPDRAQTVALFGPPQVASADQGTLSWTYCVDGCAGSDASTPRSTVAVAFDASGHIAQAGAAYLDYFANADFRSGAATVGYRGSVAQLALGCDS